MKRLSLFSMILLIALLIAAVPAVFAQEAVTVTTGDSAVNVRTGGGLEYSTRSTFYSGTLTVTGRNDFDAERVCRGTDADLDMWLRIEQHGVEGWVSRCAVVVSGDLAGVPVVEPTAPVLIRALYDDENKLPELVEEIGEAPKGDHVVGTTRARVNFREAPGLTAPVIKSLAATQSVYVTGRNDSGTWLQVMIEGETGWIARYLVLMPQGWEAKVTAK